MLLCEKQNMRRPKSSILLTLNIKVHVKPYALPAKKPSCVVEFSLLWYEVISLRYSNTSVRIQTQMFVATTCIKPKRAITLKRWMLSCETRLNVLETQGVRNDLTLEFMKMKYICMKVKAICSTGLTPLRIM